MEGKKYSVSVRTPNGAPPDYAAHVLEAGRRRAGNELYNILWGYKLPAVVDIEEISRTYPPPYFPPRMYQPENELIIEITVTPVQHRHFVVQSASFDDLRLPVNNDGVGMRERFGNWLSRLGRKISGK